MAGEPTDTVSTSVRSPYPLSRSVAVEDDQSKMSSDA